MLDGWIWLDDVMYLSKARRNLHVYYVCMYFENIYIFV